MRKLAPMFVMTSIVALVGGNAVANMNEKTTATPSATTDASASPTVPANTANLNNQSYSDKGSSEPGTNAIMDDKSKPSVAATTDDDKALRKTRKKAPKAKVAARTEPVVKSDAKKVPDASVSSSPTTSTNPPTKTTDGVAANSSTGQSTGQ